MRRPILKLRANLQHVLTIVSAALQQLRIGLESVVLRHVYLLFWKPYHYIPLPSPSHLRRCIVQPGRFADRIVVIIDAVPFGVEDDAAEESCPSYQALSYTWGSEDHPLPVLVGDMGPDTVQQVLFVTRNLHNALQNLRHPDKPRTMWIDAICINQKDNVEKGPQVAMMDSIYRKASRVVVWLGPEANNSNYAMSLMESWGSQIDTKFDFGTGNIYPASNMCDADLIDLSKPLLFSKIQIGAVAALIQRPWFTRLWIRQEISLANASATVSCGRVEVSWNTFRKALYLLARKLMHPDKDAIIDDELIRDFDAYSKAKGQVFELASQRREVSLQNLRFGFRSALCKDPRDRIYAILGMLRKKDLKSLGIAADYTKSYPDVYKKVVMQYTRVYQCLNILSECQPADKEALATANTPSWVPDWSRASPQCYDGRSFASSTIASLYSLPEDIDANQDILRVAGIILSKIETVGPRFPPSERMFDMARTLRDALSTVVTNKGHQTRGPDLDLLADTYARTLLMGHGPGITHPEDHIRGMDAYVEVLRDILTREMEPYEGNPPPPSPRYHAMWDMSQRLRNRCLSWYSNSKSTRDEESAQNRQQPVICPVEAQKGDIVAVILGCNHPMLLRPSTPSPGNGGNPPRFAVLGTCFTNEASDGKALLGPLPDGIRAASIRAMSYKWGFVSVGVEGEEDMVVPSYFDPRLEVEGLGFDVKRERGSRQSMPGDNLAVEFEPMRDLVRERTGRELRWIDLA